MLGEEKQPRLSGWGLKYCGYFIKDSIVPFRFPSSMAGYISLIPETWFTHFTVSKNHIPYEQGDLKFSTSFGTHLGFQTSPLLCNRTRSVIRSFKRISPVSLSFMPRCNQPSRPDCFLSDKRQTWQSNEINGILPCHLHPYAKTVVKKHHWKAAQTGLRLIWWETRDVSRDMGLSSTSTSPAWKCSHENVREPFLTRAKRKKPNKSKPNFWQILHHPYH